MSDELEKRLRELLKQSGDIGREYPQHVPALLAEAARIGAELERKKANKLYEDAMDAIHERAGVKRDGLVALFAWIDERKELERDAINHARDRHDY